MKLQVFKLLKQIFSSNFLWKLWIFTYRRNGNEQSKCFVNRHCGSKHFSFIYGFLMCYNSINLYTSEFDMLSKNIWIFKNAALLVINTLIWDDWEELKKILWTMRTSKNKYIKINILMLFYMKCDFKYACVTK